MATPIWFDSNAYLVNKAKQLGFNDALDAMAAFKAAGWGTDADSLYSHFQQFGNAEGVSPNGWFNTDQYLYDKAASFYGTDKVSTQQLKSMDAALKASGFSAWTHYSAYWAEDFGKDATFHNPSTQFDANKYMADKLANMMKADSTYTMDKLVKAFQDNGFDPLSHYLAYGKAEGITAKPVEGGALGQTYSLTRGDDTVIGTSGDDYIDAKAGTLGDGDYIDGGAGDDMLYATVKPAGSDVIAPEIRNVETILFRAQTESTGGLGNNHTTSYIDAGDFTFDNANAELTIGSDNSRGSLEIEDVRWNSNQTTIRFSNTDPGSVDLKVYFDPQHLKADNSTTTGVLTLQLIDTVGALNPATEGALWNNPYNGFKFTLNGTEYTLDFGAYNNKTTDGKPSYEGLVKQIQEAINKHPELSKMGLVVSEGKAFDAIVGIGDHKGEHVTGTEIIISSNQGSLEGVSWIASNGLPPTNSTSATFDANVSTDCPLIKTDVELDNVGRVQWDDDTNCLPDDIIYGDNAGELVIGSMSDRGGVERFDITVDRGSWLSHISSTNNALRMITVTGEDINGDGIVGNGELYIGEWVGAGDQLGNDDELTTWTDAAQLLDGGLKDVAVFDAKDYAGDINIGADITADSFAKYLRDVDGEMDNSANAPLGGYGGAFSYLTGKGDDVINMTVNGAVAADNDFKMNIDTGDGDDLVAFRYEDMTLNQSLDQKNLKNVTINTGAGDDTVWFYAEAGNRANPNGGSVIINTGSGKDVIYANQQENYTGGTASGDLPTHDRYNAVFVFNTSDRTIGVAGLEGATLANDTAIGASSFAVTGAAGAADGETVQVTITFKGHVVKATVKAVNSDLTSVSAEEINHAIISAITNDDVLSNLLVAKDSAGHGLLIESLINGVMTANDLSINVGIVKSDGTSGNASINTGAWYGTQFGTDNTPGVNNPYDGNSTTGSQVVVDGGADDDLIVIGPNGLADIVKVSSGNDSLIGFVTGEDKISLNGILEGTGAVSSVAASALTKNTVAAHAANAAAKNGVFTQAEVDTLIKAGVDLKFTSGSVAGDTAVVMLSDTNEDGTITYTLVKMVNGTTVTGTILGSFTMDATNGVNNTINVATDFVFNEILRDSSAGTTYSTYAPQTVGATTFYGTEFFDTFNDINDTTMSGTTTTISAGGGDDKFFVAGDFGKGTSNKVLNGNAGNDVFDVNATTSRDLGNGTFTATLNGDEGVDTFNVGASAGGATLTLNKATFNGGTGNDIFNVFTTLGTLTSTESTFNGGAGEDTFTLAANSGTFSLTKATFDGGADNDTFILKGAGTIAFGSATNTVFNGGSGDDTFDLGGTVTGAAKFDGGDGIDTFTIKSASYAGSTFIGGAGVDTLKIDAAVTAAFNLTTAMAGIENIEHAGAGLFTVSGDASLSSVKVTAAAAGTITLDASSSTMLTVELGDYAAVDKIKIGTGLTTDSLHLTNFDFGTGADVLDVTGVASTGGVYTAKSTIAGSMDLSNSTNNIAVVTDLATLTATDFTLSTASGTAIKVDDNEKYIFIVNSTDANSGDVYAVDVTGGVFTVTLLGDIDLIGTDKLTDIHADNFTA